MGLDVILPEGAIEGDDWTQAQRVFAQRFVFHGNLSRAVRECGCGNTGAGLVAVGVRMLAIPHVKRWVEKEKQRILSEVQEASPEGIIEELSKIAFGNLNRISYINDQGLPVLDLTDATSNDLAMLKSYSVVEEEQDNPEFDKDEWEKEERRALEECRENEYDVPRKVIIRKIKFDVHDKLSALEKLARVRKMFVDRVEVDINVGDADRIMAAKRRLRELREAEDAPKMIDVTPTKRSGTDG